MQTALTTLDAQGPEGGVWQLSGLGLDFYLPFFLLGTDPHVSGRAAFKDSPDFPLVLLGLVSSA